MESYATVDDLQAGWAGKTLSESERAVATELLMRATAQVAQLLSEARIVVDSENELQTYNLRTVVCNMVRRSMASYATDGVSQMSQTIGTTTGTISWSNPDGAFYLSALDYKALGLKPSGKGRTLMYAIER